VSAWVAKQKIATDLLTIFCRHTPASLLIQENADPDVQTHLESFFDEIAPEDRTKGLDDMPGHIRTALSQTHLTVPIASGRFEHRRAPHRHEIVLQLFKGFKSLLTRRRNKYAV
jgi:secondary thiamine-phosphate synthase enzyme